MIYVDTAGRALSTESWGYDYFRGSAVNVCNDWFAIFSRRKKSPDHDLFQAPLTSLVATATESKEMQYNLLCSCKNNTYACYTECKVQWSTQNCTNARFINNIIIIILSVFEAMKIPWIFTCRKLLGVIDRAFAWVNCTLCYDNANLLKNHEDDCYQKRNLYSGDFLALSWIKDDYKSLSATHSQ